jgi:hypothetical protein
MPSSANAPSEGLPLSRIVRADDIGRSEEPHEIVATAVECAAIARQFKIPAIGALRGRFLLQAGRQGRVLASLHLAARVTQICVVSLEEFEASVDEEVPLIFVPADVMAPADDDLEAPDEIPFDGSDIDLGVALTEQLALSLDPYPRKPEVVLPEAAQSQAENPFAVFFRQGRTGPGGDAKDD